MRPPRGSSSCIGHFLGGLRIRRFHIAMQYGPNKGRPRGRVITIKSMIYHAKLTWQPCAEPACCEALASLYRKATWAAPVYARGGSACLPALCALSSPPPHAHCGELIGGGGAPPVAVRGGGVGGGGLFSF